MPRGTTLRSIRVADELWTAALDKAEREGQTVSEVIREGLERYVQDEAVTRSPAP